MKTKIFILLFAIVAQTTRTMFAGSFVGFEANGQLGSQIYYDNLIQNQVNVTLVETDPDGPKYSINLTNGGVGTFSMGGVTFSYTHSEAGKTAYKTYNGYIQPNGVDREIIIPTQNGEQVKVVLVEACAGILVNGVSTDFAAGDNVLNATGSSIVLKNSSAKPKISAILSLDSESVTPDPEPTTYSGTCGENLTWNLTNGVLIISGTGVMTNWSFDSNAPWYSYKENITSVIIGNNVTSIGDYAFYNCFSLTGVLIGNNVTSIGDYAFGISAIYGCSGLTSVTIPNSVTSIGFKAFSGCTSLPVENNIRYADTYLIEVVDKSLSSYTIKDGTKWISENAFNMCGNLTSITIPNSVISIGGYAFYGCYNLSSVFVGSTPSILGGDAFNLSSINLTAIYVPCGTLTTYQSAEGWNTYSSLIKYEPLPTMIEMTNGYISIPQNSTICDEEVKLTAIPYPGYQFVRWEDGTTNNPRTWAGSIESVKAIFTYQLSGKCGKDNLLTWTLDTTSMALNITGKGALSENYTYGDYIKFLTIGNEITSIGEEAFENFRSLKQVIIGSSVKILEKDALKNCTSIETITCYSQRPPTVNNNALSGLDYSTIVYVPADYLETYKMHDTWGLYDVRPLGAASTETSGVTVTPAENTAEVVWPVVSGAATYELVIKDKDGNVICTLIFNANGQLTQIAFGAPARDHSTQQTQGTGFAFTVTGLESGTGYDLTITSKDGSGSTLDSQTISFTTTGEPQGIENIVNRASDIQKIYHNGQILILRGNHTYTLTGQEIK